MAFFAVVLLASALLPTSQTAQAGSDPTIVEVLPDGRTLSVDAGGSGDDGISVTYVSYVPHYVRVTARGEVEAGNGCTVTRAHHVGCADPDDHLKRIVIRGHKGDDAMGIGGGSNPRFVPPPGVRAFLFGGRGHDNFAVGESPVRADSKEVRAVIEGGPGRDAADTANNSDRFAGGAGADRAVAAGGRDKLLGGRRDDELLGSEGNERLIKGGAGRDRLSGGRGRDELHAKDERRDETIDCGKGDDPAPAFDRGLDPEPTRC